MTQHNVSQCPSIFIQLLQTSWGKPSRGGKMSIERSQLPIGLPVPSAELPHDHNAVIHTVEWTHWEQTISEPKQQCQTALIRDCDYNISALRFTLAGDGLTIGLRNRNIGVSRRYLGGTEKYDRSLPDGEWIRLRWNARFVDWDCGTWWYEAVVANVAYSKSKRLDSNIFVSTPPSSEVNRMIKLF